MMRERAVSISTYVAGSSLVRKTDGSSLRLSTIQLGLGNEIPRQTLLQQRIVQGELGHGAEHLEDFLRVPQPTGDFEDVRKAATYSPEQLRYTILHNPYAMFVADWRDPTFADRMDRLAKSHGHSPSTPPKLTRSQSLSIKDLFRKLMDEVHSKHTNPGKQKPILKKSMSLPILRGVPEGEWSKKSLARLERLADQMLYIQVIFIKPGDLVEAAEPAKRTLASKPFRSSRPT